MIKIEVINPDNIVYLRNRSTEEYKVIKESANMPWIVFENTVDWSFLCSMYDFTIPQRVKRCGNISMASYDEIIQNANEVIIYTNDSNNSIEECLLYITNSCTKSVSLYKKISKSYSFSVYKVILK